MSPAPGIKNAFSHFSRIGWARLWTFLWALWSRGHQNSSRLRCIMVPLTMICAGICYEFVGFYLMDSASQLTKALINQNNNVPGSMRLFFENLLFLCVLCGIQAFLMALQKCAMELWALHMRCNATHLLHFHYYPRIMSAGSALDNCDHRICEDSKRFGVAVASIAIQTCLFPGLVIYYTYYVNQHLEWPAVLFCYAYFILGVLSTTPLLRMLARLTFVIEQKEGTFRFLHAMQRERAEDIVLLKGQDYEKRRADKAFEKVYLITCKVISRDFFLYLLSQLFAYLGTAVNYLGFAVAILYYRNQEGVAPAEVAARIQMNAYACIKLISCFTIVIATFKDASEASGLASRVCQLLDFDKSQSGHQHITTVEPLLTKKNTSHRRTFFKPRPTSSPLNRISERDDESCNNHHIVDRGKFGVPAPSLSTAASPASPLTKGTSESISISSSSAPAHKSGRKNKRRSHEIMTQLLLAAPHDCIMRACNLTVGYASQKPHRSSSSSSSSPRRHTPLITDFSHTFREGRHVLITGASGVGKTSLLRTFTGLIPPLSGHVEMMPLKPANGSMNAESTGRRGSGDVEMSPRSYAGVKNDDERDDDDDDDDAFSSITHTKMLPHNGLLLDEYEGRHIFVIVQKPYLPESNLWELLHYPDEAPLMWLNPERVDEALDICALLRLRWNIKDEVDWLRECSSGEAQRLACARAYWHRPRILFIDEGTTAVDEEMEETMYNLLLSGEHPPTIISFGHQKSLNRHHKEYIHLHSKGWTVKAAETE